MRSRFVVAVQFLLMAVLLTALASCCSTSHEGVSWTATLGRSVFTAFQTVLYGVCILLVPLYAGMRLSAERSAANVDLLFSTTIKPWSVVLGKLSSGLMVGVLALSACAPFMVLSYFLRGVDVATLFFAIVMDLLALVTAVQLRYSSQFCRWARVIKVIAALA